MSDLERVSQNPFITLYVILEILKHDNPTNFLMVFRSNSRGIGHDEDAFEHKLLFMACCSDEAAAIWGFFLDSDK